MKNLLIKYGPWVLLVAAVALVLWLIYRAGKKSGTGNALIVDDNGNTVTITPQQQATAAAIAKRIYDDLNSGWAFGYNVWGNIGRDSDAYKAFAAMSSTDFGLTYQTYKDAYGSSIIADIRAEGSLPTDTYIQTILTKADNLNLA